MIKRIFWPVKHVYRRCPITRAGVRITCGLPTTRSETLLSLPTMAIVGARKSFDPQYRESTIPRSGRRAGKTLGSRNAGGRLGLVFELSQFFAQTRRFGAIFCRLGVVLDGRDAANRSENLRDSIVFAFAGVF